MVKNPRTEGMTLVAAKVSDISRLWDPIHKALFSNRQILIIECGTHYEVWAAKKRS